MKYVLLEPPDPLLRLLLLFAKIFLFLARGEIVAHATRFSERPQNARATNHTANAASAIHTATTAMAATLLTGLSFASRASWRHSARTVVGIILIASATPSGMMIRSSRCPRTGMGSGIRSMGLKAYATTTAAKARACQGALGSL